MSYSRGSASIGRDWLEGDGEGFIIALPHSCDEWIIGGVAEAKQLIEDLQALIPEIEQRLVPTNSISKKGMEE